MALPPNACRRDFARQRTSISPRCPAFFLSLDSLLVQPAECVKGSSSLANALFPDSLGIQRLFPVQALFLRPPHLFLLWLSRSRCPAPHVRDRIYLHPDGSHENGTKDIRLAVNSTKRNPGIVVVSKVYSQACHTAFIPDRARG